MSRPDSFSSTDVLLCARICHPGRKISLLSLTVKILNPSSDTGEGQKRFYQVRKFSTHDLRILDRGGPLNELELHDTAWKKGTRDSSASSSGCQQNIVIIAPSVVKRNNWVMKINSEIREAEETIQGLENPGLRKHSLGNIL